MANGVLKPGEEFEADTATNVMESGLLRVLTKQSAAPPAEDTIETELPPAPPSLPPPAPPPPPALKLVPPLDTPAPEKIAHDKPARGKPARGKPARGKPTRAAEQTMFVNAPPRRSRVVPIALAIAAVVLIGDVAMVATHRRQLPVPAAPPPLPAYMVLPPSAPAPEPPPPAAPAPPVVAQPAPSAAAPAAAIAAPPADSGKHGRHHRRAKASH